MATRTEVLRYADELEKALLEIANGSRKANKIPLEPIARLIAYARTGTTANAIVGDRDELEVTLARVRAARAYRGVGGVYEVKVLQKDLATLLGAFAPEPKKRS